MDTIYTDRKDETIDRIVRATFPAYTGKSIKIVSSQTVNCASYWDGGSRDYFVLFSFETSIASSPAPAQSAFDRTVPGLNNVVIPPGFAIVEHSIVQGKDIGITIHVHPDTLVGLLPPAGEECSRNCQIVLVATRSLKNTYGGETDIRRKESMKITGITPAEWYAATLECKARKWLNNAGAITNDGRNAISRCNSDLYAFRK